MSESKVPRRLVLPPLFFCATGLWVSAACALHFMMPAEASTSLAALGIGLVVAACACAALLFAGLQRVLLVLLGFGLGLACAGQASFVLKNEKVRLEKQGRAELLFQIVEDVQSSDYGDYAIAKARDAHGQSFRVRVNLPEGVQASCWDCFKLACTISPPSENAAGYYWQKNLVGSVSPYRLEIVHPEGVFGAISAVRAAGLEAYANRSDEGSLLLQSVSFGNRKELFASSFYTVIKRCGLAHLVAVSGAHLSIIVAFSSVLLLHLKVPRRLSIALQILVCLSFLVLAGAPYSAMRASAMVVCLLLSYFGKRASFSLNALSLCVICFVLGSPFIALSTSFLLSALSTCGIILFAEYFASLFFAAFRSRARTLCELLGMTSAAILFTLPVSLSQFGQLSLVAPLANILAAPVFALLCVGGLLAALCAWLPFGAFAVHCMCLIAQAFCEMLKLLSSLPYAATVFAPPAWLATILLATGAVFLLLRWPRFTESQSRWVLAGASCVATVLLFASPLAHGTEIVMLDVGQGDAFVLRTGSKALLVDTGNQDSAVLKGLARHDVRHLDGILITHPDDDHCGSLAAVLSFVETDRVLVARDLLDCSCANCSALRRSVPEGLLEGLDARDRLCWGAFQADVLAPEQFKEEGGNADSLVLQVSVDADGDGNREASAFFCGDAESEVLAQLSEKGLLAHADILKVGHHGSAGAFSAEQLEQLSSRLALVSAGRNNRYGHPHQETLDLLEDASVAVFRTDENGDVVCKMDGKRISVEHN